MPTTSNLPSAYDSPAYWRNLCERLVAAYTGNDIHHTAYIFAEARRALNGEATKDDADTIYAWIDDLGLRNAVLRAGFTRISDLHALGIDGLTKLRNIGPKRAMVLYELSCRAKLRSSTT
jgi:hypothetical protein